MIVDTSALVALMYGEAEAPRLERALTDAPQVLVPASCYLEACMVLTGNRPDDGREPLDTLLHTVGARILPLTEAQARAAADAFLRYGKGRHRAGLNFGDCMSYAAAMVEGLPLLYVGGGFARTDVAAA